MKFGWSEELRCLWNPRGASHAECMRRKFKPGDFFEAHGDVPGMDCSCGFHAYGRRDDSDSETTVYVVGGVIAGWGNLELHERGFKCGVAKILALFAPAPCAAALRGSPHYGRLAARKWLALKKLCADNDIPLLDPDALRDDEMRRYACERDLVLLEDQLSFGRVPDSVTEA